LALFVVVFVDDCCIAGRSRWPHRDFYVQRVLLVFDDGGSSGDTSQLCVMQNNYITTSKYSVVTFVPKNLFEQFQRIANAYFLFLLILQVISLSVCTDASLFSSRRSIYTHNHFTSDHRKPVFNCLLLIVKWIRTHTVGRAQPGRVHVSAQKTLCNILAISFFSLEVTHQISTIRQLCCATEKSAACCGKGLVHLD